jgi:hypothetical protein
MSFIACASFVAVAYITARPFVKLHFLKKDIEDDLRDYFRGVTSFGEPLLDIMLVLQENGLLDEQWRNAINAKYRCLLAIESWDDVARADRLVVEAFEEAVETLKSLEVVHQARRFENAQIRFNTIDEKLIRTRRLLHRDIPVLNGSFIHKFRFLCRFTKIPTYPMCEPIQWYEDRKPTQPRELIIYRIGNDYSHGRNTWFSKLRKV